MKYNKFLMLSKTSFVVGLLLSGCVGPNSPIGGDAGTDSDSEDTDTGSEADRVDTDTDSDTGSDTDTDTDRVDTDTDSDTGSDTDTDTDTDTVDTDTDSVTGSDSDTDTCADGNCIECTAGPCCDGNGYFKSPSEGSCWQNTEYRCLPGVCGSNGQYRIVERFCSGTSAACNGDTSDPPWIAMPDCEATDVCEMDQDNVATCRSCGEFEICEAGICSCEFEACLDVCCAEEQMCRWNDTCGIGETKLVPSDDADDNGFGWSVSVSGDVAIVGAYLDNDNGENSGSAYISERSDSGNWIQTSHLHPSDGAAYDWFGQSVSISGDVAIIGAYGDDDNGENSGSAYIFERDETGNWIEKSKLLPFDGVAYDWFGQSVSISGDVAIIGAPYNDDNGNSSGSAYIFERDETGNWIEKSKLLPSDGAADDFCGWSVSVSGEIALIGAGGDDDNGDHSGSAYIFERNETGNWIEKPKLLASDGAAYDDFGVSVSISGDVVIVGALDDDDNGESSGAAYVFERNDSGDWIQQSKLLASDGAEAVRFGKSVSVSEDGVIIGAPYDDDKGWNSGSAYVFERNESGSWKQKFKLFPSVDAAFNGFGQSISMSGDVAIVGASLDDNNGENSGSAYIFERNDTGSWNQRSHITPSDGAAWDWFGCSVSVSRDVAIIGAVLDDDNGSNSGSAYIFERDDAGNWIEKSKLLPAGGAQEDRFGISVSIDGDVAIVGASWDDDNGWNSGSAYIFERNDTGNWRQISHITPSDGAAYDWFGYSVSVSGDVVIIGAYGDDDNGSNSGSAYIFERDENGNWSQEFKLLPADGAAEDNFGRSVSVSGDVAIIGASGDDIGSAYIFERNASAKWIQKPKLMPSDGAAKDNFGSSVSVSGDVAIVGASWDDDNGENSGSAFIFERNDTGNWNQRSHIMPSDGAAYDWFGCSVSVSRDVTIIGAFGNDDNGSQSGSAYIF